MADRIRTLNILLVAEESAGVQVLRHLVQSPHRIVAVLTAPPTRGGGASVGSVAAALEVPNLPCASVREPGFADWIRENDVDLLLNVHSLYVVHRNVLDAPRFGSFNLHPGPLPEYAGLNAPSWAIYNGESTHAVTVHRMNPEIDAGAIAYSASFAIDEADTGLSVSIRCIREGVALVTRLIQAAAHNPDAIPAVAQDPGRRRYFGREVPQDGMVVWSEPAQRVRDFIRACDFFPFPSPWGEPKTRLNGDELTVLKAEATDDATTELPGTIGAHNGGVAVACADKWVRVLRVRMNGRPVDARVVLAPGMRLL
jgi:methionyl-tRNA formyltransferase